MSIRLIPQVRKVHKRWTTWLLALATVLSSLQAFMPGIQQYISPQTYSGIMIGLAVVTWIAAQVKQDSVSGVKP